MENYKQYLAKYFTNLVSILTLVGMIFFGVKVYKNEKRADAERLLLEERYSKLIGKQSEFVQLSETVGQLATLYKKQEDLAKQVAEAWRNLKIENEERIKLTSTTTATVESETEKQSQSDYVFTTKDGTKGYVLNELRIAGKDSPAIGYILVKNDGQVFKKNYRFELHVESVQLKDDLTGKVRIVSRAYLVPLENGLAEKRRPDLKRWAGEKYPLEVTGGETVVDPQEPMQPDFRKKTWVPWALNLNGGFGVFGAKGGALDTKVTVDTNLLGYGFSKQDLDWKLIHVGANYSKTGGLGFHAMPFSYRPLPGVLVNSYVGPGVFLTPEEYGYFIGLNIGF